MLFLHEASKTVVKGNTFKIQSTSETERSNLITIIDGLLASINYHNNFTIEQGQERGDNYDTKKLLLSITTSPLGHKLGEDFVDRVTGAEKGNKEKIDAAKRILTSLKIDLQKSSKAKEED